MVSRMSDCFGSEADIAARFGHVRYTPQEPTNSEAVGLSAKCRLCCKSRKLQGYEFFAKTQNGKQSPIRITSIALPKSPVSFARGDEVPHIFTRNARLQPAEFLIIGAKRDHDARIDNIFVEARCRLRYSGNHGGRRYVGSRTARHIS